MLYRASILKSHRLPVPVIIVGNITVGGTGKTPFVIQLIQMLKAHGYQPGIISRGYGGNFSQAGNTSAALAVTRDSDPARAGDEPVMLAGRCECPVYIHPDRVLAGRQLLQETPCDIIVADDGLQHYALRRDVEIAVIDGDKRLGNGYCLPAGPLREGPARLKSVDFVIANGKAEKGEYEMRLEMTEAVRVSDPGATAALSAFKAKKVHAVAGIGNPARFFDQLRGYSLDIIEHPFADHYAYQPQDIDFDDQLPVLMTEKDAVKCKHFAGENHWYVPVTATCDAALFDSLLQLLNNKTQQTHRLKQSNG